MCGRLLAVFAGVACASKSGWRHVFAEGCSACYDVTEVDPVKEGGAGN